MPLYEYRCADCGAEFEELAGADETPACPSCHSTHTIRLLSACSHQGCCAPRGNYSPSSLGGGGGCAGCSGGHCATCH